MPPPVREQPPGAAVPPQARAQDAKQLGPADTPHSHTAVPSGAPPPRSPPAPAPPFPAHTWVPGGPRTKPLRSAPWAPPQPLARGRSGRSITPAPPRPLRCPRPAGPRRTGSATRAPPIASAGVTRGDGPRLDAPARVRGGQPGPSESPRGTRVGGEQGEGRGSPNRKAERPSEGGARG